ncbi:Pyridoxal kinase-like protein [Drosera capensis]
MTREATPGMTLASSGGSDVKEKVKNGAAADLVVGFAVGNRSSSQHSVSHRSDYKFYRQIFGVLVMKLILLLSFVFDFGRTSRLWDMLGIRQLYFLFNYLVMMLIPSTQFSSQIILARYPTFKGQVLNGKELWDLVEGLAANDLLYYTHLLTGYIGSVSFLNAVLEVVDKLRSVNPRLVYVCDPVMGDEGKLYVPPELVAVYREKVVPVASMLTPNQFEAEQLTGLRIGLHQGSSLSPFLFAIVMGELSKNIQDNVSWCMLFADDIVLIDETREGVSAKFESWCEKLEVKEVRMGMEVFPRTHCFKYLGSVVQENGEIDEDIVQRTRAEWNKWREVVVVEMRMLRWMCGVSLRDIVSNGRIRGRLGVAAIEDKMREARLRWITSEEDGRAACNILHAAGPEKFYQNGSKWKNIQAEQLGVVLTSINIDGNLLLISSHRKEKLLIVDWVEMDFVVFSGSPFICIHVR